MIIIKRSDGVCINLSSCKKLSPYSEADTIATYDKGHYYIIKDFSIDELSKLTATTWSAATIIHKEFTDPSDPD